MKAIKSEDSGEINKIEAARYTFLTLQAAFDRLIRLPLRDFAANPLTEAEAIEVLHDAWSIVDYGNRFCQVSESIRGLKRKDPRREAMMAAARSLNPIRNYIQHLKAETSTKLDEIAPILGALSWCSADGKQSFTLTLGTLPTGAALNSLGADATTNRYADQFLLDVGPENVDLKQVYFALADMFQYIEEHLQQAGMLWPEDLIPVLLTTGELRGPRASGHFRVRIVITEENKRHHVSLLRDDV